MPRVANALLLLGEAIAREGLRGRGGNLSAGGVGSDACLHAIAQARVVSLTAPDPGALAYAARGVRRTANRYCVWSNPHV